MKYSLSSISTLFSLAALAAITSGLSAQVTTNPVGYVTLDVLPGTGTGRVTTPMSIPLYQPASGVGGATTGVINGVTSNSITVTDAGWTAAELSTEAAPYIIRITSGNAEGRNLLISSATSNTSSIAYIDLPSSSLDSLIDLGISEGSDTFEIITCGTLSSIFGAPSSDGIVGGATIDQADQLIFMDGGTILQCYFDTDLGYWTIVSGRNQPDLSNQVLMPDSGLLFMRKAASPSSFVLTGSVPQTRRDITVNAAGLTFYASAWPADTTLAATGIADIDGWQISSSSTVLGSADTVKTFVNGTATTYYHDGTNWRKVDGRNPAISDDVVIAAGSAILISKTSPHVSDSFLSQPAPYSL